MRLVEPTLGEIMTLVALAAQDERDQFAALSGREWDIDDVAVFFYRQPGIKFALLDDAGNPLAAGGYYEISPGIWHDWLVGSEAAWTTHWRAITKACRLVMKRMFTDLGAVQLKTTALASREKACHWYVKGLKMRYVGAHRTVEGHDVVLYERGGA